MDMTSKSTRLLLRSNPNQQSKNILNNDNCLTSQHAFSIFYMFQFVPPWLYTVSYSLWNTLDLSNCIPGPFIPVYALTHACSDLPSLSSQTLIIEALILLMSPGVAPNHHQFHYSVSENEMLHSLFINFWKEALMWGFSIRRMNIGESHVIIRPKQLKMIFWSPFQVIYSLSRMNIEPVVAMSSTDGNRLSLGGILFVFVFNKNTTQLIELSSLKCIILCECTYLRMLIYFIQMYLLVNDIVIVDIADK